MDGRLRSGDIILKINNIEMIGMGSENAATILKETGDSVELEIARGELPQFDQVASPTQEVFEVDLKKDSSGIGIHIAGWVNDGNRLVHVKGLENRCKVFLDRDL